MKTILPTILMLTGCAAAGLADDTKASANLKTLPSPKKGKITFEYSYPPPPTVKPPSSAAVAPLPRVGSAEWLRRVAPQDRKLMTPWEWRRLNAWRGAYSVIEPPPWANNAGSTGQ
jgi:hypothetical protein